MREVIDAARRVTGREIPVREEDRRPGDPPELVAANARAREELGWAPRRGLDEMIADAWAWHQAHPRGYRRLKQRLERGDAGGQHRGRLLRGVDHGEALGLGRRQLVVRGADRLEEGELLALEPVGGLRALAGPREPFARLDPQQQRAVRRQPAGGEQVQRADLLHAEAAPGALVGERGVDEAVEQHPVAGREQRLELLGDELRAGRRVEQRLRARVHFQGGILHERADALGELDAAGLAQHERLLSSRVQRAGERADERRLAGAVEPLDGDQAAAVHVGGRY